MPIYEYRCSSCGQQQEVMQKISDPPLTTCPKCGQPTLAKMLTAAGFQLKGSGWYATDFKSTGKKPADKKPDAGKEGKTESKPETKTDGKSESKSETKSETKAAA